MSPIGQLSTANDNSNTADRRAISDLIDSTESGLNAIKRPLSSDEQKTATLIRTYITRARDALKADDLDGARTLANKAHQLLGELTKP
jgi:tRNA C32,U32 (ribose-2'-O)-methylase TrmJ